MPRKDKRNSKAKASRRSQSSRLVVNSSLPRAYIPGDDFFPALQKQLAPFRNISQQMFRTKTFYTLAAIQQSPSVDTTGAFYVTAGLAPNFADFSTVFDVYRLVGCAIRFTPNITENLTTQNTSYMPRLYTVIDLDDANVPLNRAYMLSYDNLCISPPCTPVTRVFLPHTAIAVYGGISFNAYGNTSMGWIDVASPNAQHYGVKWLLESGAVAQTALQSYTIDVELFMEFKAVR